MTAMWTDPEPHADLGHFESFICNISQALLGRYEASFNFVCVSFLTDLLPINSVAFHFI